MRPEPHCPSGIHYPDIGLDGGQVILPCLPFSLQRRKFLLSSAFYMQLLCPRDLFFLLVATKSVRSAAKQSCLHFPLGSHFCSFSQDSVPSPSLTPLFCVDNHYSSVRPRSGITPSGEPLPSWASSLLSAVGASPRHSRTRAVKQQASDGHPLDQAPRIQT